MPFMRFYESGAALVQERISVTMLCRVSIPQCSLYYVAVMMPVIHYGMDGLETSAPGTFVCRLWEEVKA